MQRGHQTIEVLAHPLNSVVKVADGRPVHELRVATEAQARLCRRTCPALAAIEHASEFFITAQSADDLIEDSPFLKEARPPCVR